METCTLAVVSLLFSIASVDVVVVAESPTVRKNGAIVLSTEFRSVGAIEKEYFPVELDGIFSYRTGGTDAELVDIFRSGVFGNPPLQLERWRDYQSFRLSELAETGALSRVDVFLPRAVGTFKLQAVLRVPDGEIVRSKPIEIQVVEADPRQAEILVKHGLHNLNRDFQRHVYTFEGPAESEHDYVERCASLYDEMKTSFPNSFFVKAAAFNASTIASRRLTFGRLGSARPGALPFDPRVGYEWATILKRDFGESSLVGLAVHSLLMPELFLGRPGPFSDAEVSALGREAFDAEAPLSILRGPTVERVRQATPLN